MAREYDRRISRDDRSGTRTRDEPAPHDFARVVAALRRAGCVFAEEEALLLTEAARSRADLAALVRLRTRGIPLEHVLGWAEFMGLRVAVARGVFVPRRRSALLVREAAARVSSGDVVLDLCCGSGALGLALARSVDVALHAADVSLAAVDSASRNLAPVGGHVYRGDLFGALPDGLRGTFRVVLCNAPYVPTGLIGTLPPEARLHEPVGTLDGGADGLDVVRRVAHEAPPWLAEGGHLLVESSTGQAATAASVFEEAGLRATIVHDADLEATAVIGTSLLRGASARD